MREGDRGEGKAEGKAEGRNAKKEVGEVREEGRDGGGEKTAAEDKEGEKGEDKGEERAEGRIVVMDREGTSATEIMETIKIEEETALEAEVGVVAEEADSTEIDKEEDSTEIEKEEEGTTDSTAIMKTGKMEEVVDLAVEIETMKVEEKDEEDLIIMAKTDKITSGIIEETKTVQGIIIEGTRIMMADQEILMTKIIINQNLEQMVGLFPQQLHCPAFLGQN